MIKIRFVYLFFLLSFIGYWNTLNCINSNPITLEVEDQQTHDLQKFIRDSINSGISVEQIVLQAQELGYNEAFIKTALEKMLKHTRENNGDEASKKRKRSLYVIGGIGCGVIVAAIIYMLIRRHQDHQRMEAMYRPNDARPLTINMQVVDDFADRPRNADEIQQLNREIALEIQRQIHANRPCRDIIENIRTTYPYAPFQIQTEGRGSLAGLYWAYNGNRIPEGGRIGARSLLEGRAPLFQ